MDEIFTMDPAILFEIIFSAIIWVTFSDERTFELKVLETLVTFVLHYLDSQRSCAYMHKSY